ncbi:MAG: hypothetical protein QMD09_03105 [Desulfatibacillaceae bacterium]|nr:hypothetical protein [Desulfatibacillaceae bacterium]
MKTAAGSKKAGARSSRRVFSNCCAFTVPRHSGGCNDGRTAEGFVVKPASTHGDLLAYTGNCRSFKYENKLF